MTRTRRRPSLLLIEDNPGDVDLFQWAMQGAQIDYELKVIGDGGIAMDLVRQTKAGVDDQPPDLIVLDLNLPKVSGSDVLRAMRSTSTFQKTPVIVWTSSNAARDRAQLEDLNVALYMVKPSDLDELETLGATLRSVVENSLQRGG